jgi:hypothetical protein
MKRAWLAFLSGCAIAAGGAYLLFHDRQYDVVIAELQQVVTTTNESLLGYTKYKDYLSASKKSLGGQTKFLAATVTRKYTVARGVEGSILGVKSKGSVLVSYTAEYSFGYDLAPSGYEVVDTPTGIEIRVGKPKLVATPAVHGLRYEVLASGWFTDEKLAALDLYEGASTLARADGLKLQSDEEIVALCEKRLTAFLRDFLAKQPGVKHVPTIAVSYTPPAIPGTQAQ